MPYLKKMIYINNYPLAEDCLLYLPPKDFF